MAEAETNTSKKTFYSAEFKAKALEQIDQGKSLAEVSKELGIKYNLLYNWYKSTTKSSKKKAGKTGRKTKKSALPKGKSVAPTRRKGAPVRAAEELGDLSEIQKEMLMLKEERDFLRRILMAFAGASYPGGEADGMDDEAAA